MNTYWILFITITVASWLVSALMEQRFKKFSKVYLHLTGKEVAEKMGISQSYISRLEKKIIVYLITFPLGGRWPEGPDEGTAVELS